MHSLHFWTLHWDTLHVRGQLLKPEQVLYLCLKTVWKHLKMRCHVWKFGNLYTYRILEFSVKLRVKVQSFSPLPTLYNRGTNYQSRELHVDPRNQSRRKLKWWKQLLYICSSKGNYKLLTFWPCWTSSDCWPLDPCSSSSWPVPST